MNVFYLDQCPLKAADYHCDKHIPKMIVEYAQLLSTAHRMLDGTECKKPSKSGKTMRKHWKLYDPIAEDIIYAPTHYNHPSAVWVREDSANYFWLYKCFEHLIDNFQTIFNKQHKTAELLNHLIIPPRNIRRQRPTPIRLAITPPADQFTDRVSHSPVEQYRVFYATKRGRMEIKWSLHGGSIPDWWESACSIGAPIGKEGVILPFEDKYNKVHTV